MMLPYTYVAGRLAEERMRDNMREGEHARLMRMARPVGPGLLDQALASIGGLLLSAGERLQERYALAETGLTGSPSLATQ